ncbi:carboxylesterase/lipase family protein [Variovorax sp. Sphag1AA]|uniref:carboxylesterase/lipase family protein n=1 Tax=Variovorax sp. Sphag1AA TaxID=2587027 RepID=UPI0018045B3B|nr:carboxylesterase family protein [Variovorax sp. Sphag1AA]MBB3181051.1 para-nitrobenzyl esterase [Variovorax sp. Sphag1AA]
MISSSFFVPHERLYPRYTRKVMMGASLALAALGAVSSIAAPQPRSEYTSPIVTTTGGAVRGVRENGVNVYRGIPYAAPPVGELRWQPPQPPKPWQGIREASKPTASCAQVTTLGPFAGPASIQEDCLYLNVYTTGKTGGKAAKPVIVWIHGGGNFTGAAKDYDATKLATGGTDGIDAVVVTFNYRLGLLGTLSHPALNTEGHPWGNYQTLDQQAALLWVQQNIARFAGDPSKVALGGQSAGAYDVGANLISPSAKGLFNRAILQSSPAFFAWTPSAATALTAGTGFAVAAGCPGSDSATAKCLRGLSVARILQLQGTPTAGGSYVIGRPFVDGTIVPMQPEEAWVSGKFNRMPVMGGSVRDEVTFFTGINEYFSGPPQAPISASQYPSMTAPGAFCIYCNANRKMPEGIAEQYPLSDHNGDPMIAYQRISTDAARCAELHVLQRLAPQVPTYAYDFAYRNAPFYLPKMPGYKPGASHTIDIQFLFTGFHGGELGVNLDQMSGMPRGLNSDEEKLSHQMIAAWTHFADTGNPNGSGDAPWPRLNEGNDGRYLVQDIPMSSKSVAAFRADHKCDFFDAQLQY